MTKTKTTYVDGFVLVIAKKNVAAYKKMAEEASEVWMRFGALSYKECMLDDAKPPQVALTFPKLIQAKPPQVALTFPKLIQAKPSETVWFSYIEYKSKAHRDSVNKKVKAYFDKKYKDMKDYSSMPFDMNRMSYGGFTVEVSA